MSLSPHQARFRWIGMSPDGRSVRLERYDGAFTPPPHATSDWFETHPEAWRTAAVVDVETTGMDSGNDKIIEIGVRLFRFDRQTGAVLAKETGYNELEDPGMPLSPEIMRLTGITDELVRGKQIDWDRVKTMLEGAQLIIAHNAAFDRPFVEGYLPALADKVWACSLKQVDWSAKGFPSQKLEILSIYHGFFCDAHRALTDVDALLYLLSLPDPELQTPYLAELLGNARRRMSWVLATHSPFESKDVLRQRGYRWDPENRVWGTLIYSSEVEAECTWLCERVYAGPFRGLVRELAPSDLFKKRV